MGSKARYETEEGVQELKVYIHHVSEFFQAAQNHDFTLVDLREWFDKPAEEQTPPRLLSMVFQKR